MFRQLAEQLKDEVFYQEDDGLLVRGDCLDILPMLPENSVDLVLTDPPYNVRWKSAIELHGRKAMMHFADEVKKGWDNVCLKELYRTIFPHFDKLLKVNGSVLLFTSQEGVGYAKDEGMKNGLDMKCQMIWEKLNPPPQVRKKNYLSTFECIIWLARWEKKCNFTFNFGAQNEMKNIFRFPLCQGQERTAHPTQKPQELIKKLLLIHSNEGDIVLDPFLGSGTTAVACKQLGRRFIGCDINAKYCEIAKKRIMSVSEPLF
ncbi:MAG: Modification methylase DpnIIB [candidate division WS2 bacterium]|nr:Modification methylase DpnIIB [Candidatus Lithacetigena glycinireducens]